MRFILPLVFVACEAPATTTTERAVPAARSKGALTDDCTPRSTADLGEIGSATLEQARQLCLFRRDVRDLAAALQAIADRPVSIADAPRPKRRAPDDADE